MSSESHHHGTNSNTGKNKRGILLSTKLSRTHLDEAVPDSKTAVDNLNSTPQLVDPNEENICNWMDSGFLKNVKNYTFQSSCQQDHLRMHRKTAEKQTSVLTSEAVWPLIPFAISLSTSKDLQESREKAALSPPLGMVQMTVQNYMRSLHRFSEMPVLSRWSSVSSSHSVHSAPKSVTEWLDFWEKDPVEVLLDLGFGTDEPDICTKIPSRFISYASAAKGINIRVFIEAQRQRMDVENPNLCGRFRQLQVLDHVTSAFSSLLSNINTMQQKSEERKGEEKSMEDTPKGKPAITHAKRKRIGQLLRKVSRQTTMHGPQAHRNVGMCKTKEDLSFAVDVDKCIATRTGLAENTALVSLKEEPASTEEDAITVSQPLQSIASKTRVLPYLPIKQSHLPSTSELPIKDRPRKEPNLLLTHMLRRVSGLNCKPTDSFEMEEIQSFEDESSWGNPLESTSEAIVTRTNSCQSDSSGFLEDPSEPLPLQVPSLPGSLRLSCNSHDSQAFLRHKKDSTLTSQDFQFHTEGRVANTSTADGSTVLLLPSLSREHTFQGEDIFYSINEDDDDLLETFRGLCENGGISETVDEMDEEEMQGERGQLEAENSCAQPYVLCCHGDDMDQDPERNCLSCCSEMHKRVGSTANEENGMTSIGLSDGQIFEDRQESEEPLTEEETRDVYKDDVLEGVEECVEGAWYDMKAYKKLNSPILVTDIGSGCPDSCKTDVELYSSDRPLDGNMASQMEHEGMATPHEINVISRTLEESNLSPHYCERKGFSSLDISSVSTELEKVECIPSSEANTNSFKSVTVQMPSQLVSNIQNMPLGEAALRSQSMDFTSKVYQCSKDEPLISPVLGASKEEDKQVREASIQTERSQTKRETLPLFRVLPSFHGHGHLVKSASLDTGLYGKYRPPCHEHFNTCCAQLRGHCCPLSSQHCCLLWPFSLAPSCKHSVACCSSHTTIELQLLKTLKLLQDTAIRNISSCTIHEIKVMKNSCQVFRERLDVIEQQLIEQEALFSSAMSDEGREERRRLQVLRQAVRREVTELECQLQDRTHQQLDQLLDEQSNLCSELGISAWKEEREVQNKAMSPDAATSSPRALCLKGTHHRPPKRSATVPSSPSTSVIRKTELHVSALATGKTNSTADPNELHTHKKETKGPAQPKLDFKAFIQNLKKSFRNSFSNDTTEGKD